jgi:hypothetical protein
MVYTVSSKRLEETVSTTVIVMLVIKHNAGFFSCCSVRLHEIVGYARRNRTLPLIVDSSAQFHIYRVNRSGDATFDFFEDYRGPEFRIPEVIDYRHTDQFKPYRLLDFVGLAPFVTKYFSPSESIRLLRDSLLQRYGLDLGRHYCGVYYRGTDKGRETKLASCGDFLERMRQIRHQDKGVRFIVQTDSWQFKEEVKRAFPMAVFFRENQTSKGKRGLHKESSKEVNHQQIRLCLAVFLILAQCRQVVCGSSNGSMWIMLYRGHANGVIQFLNGHWV